MKSLEIIENPATGLTKSSEENHSGENEVSNSSSNKEPEVETIELFENKYSVVDDYKGLKTIDELKSHLPLMKNKLFKHLKADIKRNGMNSSILYIISSDGKKLVIDGHTRLRAAIELKLKTVPTKEIANDFSNKDDLILWMVKHQFQQRNLSSVEKLQLAFLSKETIEKKAKDNLMKGGKKELVDKPIDTNNEIAKITGVSRATAVRYSRVINSGSEKVKKAMFNGAISISAAEKTLKKSEDKKEQPAKEKKYPQVNIFSSQEEGTKSLSEGKIEVLVFIKDQQQIEMFNSKQIEKFGFFVADLIEYEPVAKKSVAQYEELA